MLSCCLPLVWMETQQESMTIPKAAHTKLLMMGEKTRL
jgi:hypothetical protein